MATVRSLGRRGITVGAFDENPRTPAFRSRWCATSDVLPPVAEDPDAFVGRVLELVDRHSPRVVMVAHDGTIEALRSRRSAFDGRTSLALAPEEALALAVHKSSTLSLAEDLGIAVPRGVLVEAVGDLRSALSEVGFPAVIKPVTSWVESGDLRQRLVPQVAVDFSEAKVLAERFVGAGSSILVQEWLPGAREEVWLFYADGQFWARFSQRAWRVYPLLGGASVMRESIPPPTDILDAAERLVAAAGLVGVSDVEFRRDVDGTPKLMEMNPRLPASAQLANHAGVDLPLMLYRWAAGEPLKSVPDYRYGVRVRWLAGDLLWLRETLRSHPGRPDVEPRSQAVRAFLGDCVTPSGYDYWSLTDPWPALAASSEFCTASMRKLRNREARLPTTARPGANPIVEAEPEVPPAEWRVPTSRGAWFYWAGNHLHHLQVSVARRRCRTEDRLPNGIRILCYHRVADERDELAVTPRNFREQMERILALGMTPISLREVSRLLETGADGRFVCVTFDDGYRDCLQHAVPVLRELSIPATVFIPTAAIDGTCQLYWYDEQPPLLNWDELMELAASDHVSVGAHSRFHPSLPAVPDAVAWDEIAGCKRELEDRLGQEVTGFAYPAGLFTERDARMVRDAGYLVGVTCDPGLNVTGTRPELLHRSIVDRRDDILMVEGKLTGLLDSPWGVQPLKASLRRRRS